MTKKINSKKQSVSLYTIGCRVNQSETDIIRNQLKESGYQTVAAGTPADIAIINTCTVTSKGDSDARRLINKIIRLNKHTKIALVGCQAQVQKESLLELPNVCWIVGTAKKFDLPSILEKKTKTEASNVIVPKIKRQAFSIPITESSRSRTRPNLKIQDGCDSFCSYCEVPFARGPARSRNFQNIIDEAVTLVEGGHKEIVLTGINIGLYKFGSKNLISIIEALEQIEDLKRIRISSIEPTSIQWDLIKKMSESRKLCRFLHIPIQSGSNRILKLMERKYSLSQILKFINFAHKEIPQICIGTDVIVGFPGETDEDFQKTFEALETSPVNYFHVFSYSRRNKTKSRNMPDTVDEKIIKHRSKILRDLSNKKRFNYFTLLIGTRQQVLFEEKKKGMWSGVTDHYVRVYVKSQKKLRNSLTNVKLKGIRDQAMTGQLI